MLCLGPFSLPDPAANFPKEGMVEVLYYGDFPAHGMDGATGVYMESSGTPKFGSASP